ncbi:PEP-CTERM sorting domain-containing protein [Vibrio sp. PNB23_22_6]|uniref:PEP-CTERM sorting domain-containing protein n=1 Tax=Vibrio TaxID=662 RepID=UPI004067F11D
MEIAKYGLYTALATSLAFASQANAVIIDDFDNPDAIGVNYVQDTTVDDSGSGNPSEATYDDPLGILGGERDLWVKLLDNPEGSLTGVALSVAAGSLSYGTGSSVVAEGKIQYDGNDNDAVNIDTAGLGSVDLTLNGGDAFLLDVIDTDLGFTFGVQVWSALGTETDTVVYTASGATTGLAALAFSDFVGVDFTDVSAIEFTINTNGKAGQADIDFSIGSVVSVPEPASIAFFGAGLLGLGLLRRRKSQL